MTAPNLRALSAAGSYRTRAQVVHLPGMEQHTNSEPQSVSPVFLTSREVADMLRIPVRTVEDWRLTRSGPPWVKFGRHVRYNQAELLDWVEGHRRA
ncbi:helix-turn-helix domain-containing protein [Leucobacter sp. gxy201]|uniref:helix-turn-helix domain-containing protein n=1 Tax=Leucobacter sp. gxy201 TaxID=2957200 RepID=UPI003DA0CB0C